MQLCIFSCLVIKFKSTQNLSFNQPFSFITKMVYFVNLQFLMGGRAGHSAPVFEKYQEKAEFFMCSCLGKGSRNVQRTPGGLIFRQRWNNLQFVTGASFLLSVYSDYLTSARKNLNCASGSVSPSELLSFAKSQVTLLLKQTNYSQFIVPILRGLWGCYISLEFYHHFISPHTWQDMIHLDYAFTIIFFKKEPVTSIQLGCDSVT